jgi:serine phosphatase RsbU (regulator of sigma subunit)
LTFAGSKNPLFYYQKSSNQIIKVEADRRYIGMIGTKAEFTKFRNKDIYLSKGDIVFLCTDGYIDQSNDARKRLGTKLFTEYLLEFAELPMKEFKNQLEDKLKEWQGTQNQRDDISVIGIRIQ